MILFSHSLFVYSYKLSLNFLCLYTIYKQNYKASKIQNDITLIKG